MSFEYIPCSLQLASILLASTMMFFLHQNTHMIRWSLQLFFGSTTVMALGMPVRTLATKRVSSVYPPLKSAINLRK